MNSKLREKRATRKSQIHTTIHYGLKIFKKKNKEKSK